MSALMASPQLSIVLPAYNEGARITEALARTVRYIDERGLDAEVVVVNDGSKDDTLQKAEQFATGEPRVRVLSHSPNHGKGYAVKRGMLDARGQCRIFLDVDMATPVELIDDMLPVLASGADVVIGSRHLPESVIEVSQSAIRRWMGSAFRKIAGMLLPLNVSDVTCGFKGMRAESADAIFAVQNECGWAFDAELIFVARKWDLDLREVPVRWRDSSDTTVRPFAAAWASFNELLRIRRHDRRGAYARPQSGHAE